MFDAGIEMSLEDLLDHVANIREPVTIFYTRERGGPRVDVQLEEMDETEKKLFEVVEGIGV